MDATCTSCGKAIATAEIVYTEQAKIVCTPCSLAREITRDAGRAARNIKISAVTALLAGVFGLGGMAIDFALFFYAGAIISIGATLLAWRPFVLPGSERFTKYLTKADRTVIFACAGLALAIALVELLAIKGVIHIGRFNSELTLPNYR